MPTAASSRTFWESMRRLDRVNVKMNLLRFKYTMAQIMLMAWEPMVAKATPATPSPAYFTRITSPATLRAQERR